MARKQEFDTNDALSKATGVFWTLGYEKSSVRHLQKAMNIGESSFYHAFKGKKALYIKCLDHYNTKITANRLKYLQSDKPVGEKLRDFFKNVIDEQAMPKYQKGCLMTNSIASEVLSEKEIQSYVHEQFDKFRMSLTELLIDSKQKNELLNDHDIEQVADILITHLQGIFKLSLLTEDFRKMWKSTELLLSTLGF